MRNPDGTITLFSKPNGKLIREVRRIVKRELKKKDTKTRRGRPKIKVEKFPLSTRIEKDIYVGLIKFLADGAITSLNNFVGEAVREKYYRLKDMQIAIFDKEKKREE